MKFVILAALCAALSGCAAVESHLARAPDPTGGQRFCTDPDTPACRFLNEPVRLSSEQVALPGRPYLFRETLDPLEFVDASGRRWRAPAGTLTDGASVPRIFTSIVGSPTAPEFVNAAVMHDAMCGVGNTDLPGFHDATWEATHRMFYEGLRVGGTEDPRAKVMFAAVYLGGPRWLPGDRRFNDPALGSIGAFASTQGRPSGPTRGLDDWAAEKIPLQMLLAVMRQTKAYIERNDPSIGEIERYINGLERRALRAAATGDPGEGMHDAPEEEPDTTEEDDPGDQDVPGETPGDPTGNGQDRIES